MTGLAIGYLADGCTFIIGCEECRIIVKGMVDVKREYEHYIKTKVGAEFEDLAEKVGCRHRVDLQWRLDSMGSAGTEGKYLINV